MKNNIIFETERLVIRKANPIAPDVDFLFKLWTTPAVMKFVGFPYGLKTSKNDIQKTIANHDQTEYNQVLMIELKETRQIIGQCKLGTPNEAGISETDVKLAPEFWGNRFGVEVKQGLVDYLFTHTNCTIIQATPNQNNIASQKMQEQVGGVRVGEGVFRFPERMKDYTTDVPHYVYHVYRKDWQKTR